MVDSYWIAFGDIHDDISRLHDIPELPGAAGIIVTGDITLGGGVKQAARVLEPLAESSPRILAQLGNMDRGEVTAWLEEKGWNLHARSRKLFSDVLALGVGCSNFSPFGTPSEYPESRLAEWMEEALAEARNSLLQQEDVSFDARPGMWPQTPRLVLVSHTPPHATNCDRLQSGAPVGSTAVREFIEEHQPDVCLCGHIHEARAEDRIGRTHVINPGTLAAGGYVILRRAARDNKAYVSAELKIL